MTLSIQDIPVEVFIDHLLPQVPINDILNLTQTCTFFASLCKDETFWKRNCRDDYNFTGAGTARTSGWRFIYRGLFNPRVFVWGEKSKGRLGLEHFPTSVIRGGIPFPVQLKMKAQMVALLAGGMSFHGLDSEGIIHVFGTLNGLTGALRMEGFDEAGKTATTPHRLRMPAPTRSISCGRLHSMSLDANGDIWTFVNWGRPFKLPHLSEYLRDTQIQQIEAGWTFNAVLTKLGEVIIWWPFGDPLREQLRAMIKEMSIHQLEDNVIPCATWDLPGRFHAVLPPLPDLPKLPSQSEHAEDEVKIVQIAGLEDQIVGLTNHGHALKFSHLPDEQSMRSGRWEYLPNFSEVEEIRKHPTFSTDNASGSPLAEPPVTMKITHITGSFRRFTAYSTHGSSIVLMGETDAKIDSLPTILPELQNRSVISVVIGDYHNAALTSDGKLFTWGGYSLGALGLGDPMKVPVGSPGGFRTENERELATSRGHIIPPPVDKPTTEVRFDHQRKTPRDRFCFAATAAGWHMGALVIDLEPDEEGEEMEEQSNIPVPGIPHGPPIFGPGEIPSVATHPRGGGIFRIGFAGRGGGVGQ